MSLIREYKPEDAREVERCYVELQDNEHRLAPLRAEGQAVFRKYLEYMFARCAETDGRVFVAEEDGRIIGFVCVFAHVVADELINAEPDFAFVSDLVVLEEFRGRGLGFALLERAEAYAAERGAKRIRLSVLAANAPARALYEKFGFEDFEVSMMKTLTPTLKRP